MMQEVLIWRAILLKKQTTLEFAIRFRCQGKGDKTETSFSSSPLAVDLLIRDVYVSFYGMMIVQKEIALHTTILLIGSNLVSTSKLVCFIKVCF